MRDSTIAENVLAKKAGEEVLFHFDWSRRLLTGETITAQAVTHSPSGLTIGTPSLSGSKVQVSIKAGVAGVTYSLLCEVSTSLGQKRQVTGYLNVEV